MVDLNEKVQRPWKREDPQAYPDVDPHAAPTHAPPRPPNRGRARYPRHPLGEILSMRSLFWPVVAMCLGFALRGFWCHTAPACTAGDANAPGVAITGTPEVATANVPEITIAVMGATGSGKTSFINLLSKSNFTVGKGLRSCTNTVQPADAFDLDGRRVVLIDTPGFDDTSLSDTDVLNMIAAFLANSYEQGKKLAGVLYFHRISDLKMTGISRKNFGMFRKLCGDNALRNVVIVTNMWGQVDLEIGNEREAELMREDDFFKPVLDKGARTERHDNTTLSAEKIIRLILGNGPLPLHIQEELVDEHKAIPDTDAGEELNRDLNAQIERHQREMRVLREDMEQAMREKDEETRRELDTEIRMLQMKTERLQHDSKRMASDYDQLRDALRSEKAQRRKLARILDRLRDGFFSKIAAYLDGVDL